MSFTGAAATIGLKSVLIAYDFSEASDKPLRHALAIARHFGAKLYLAYVVSSIGYTMAGQEAISLAAEGATRDAQKLEQRLLASGALAGLDYEFLVREGDIWEQLEQVIREKRVDMVVVGTHGRKGLRKLLLGSVAEQIFRRADCFVATVGPASFEDAITEKAQPVRPFLFPTDFGPASLHALPYALSFAEQFGTKLVVLQVLPAAPIPEGFHWSKTGDLPEMREKARMASEKQFEQLVLEKAQKATPPEFVVKFGIPSDQILQAARSIKADLIVMGLKRPAHIQTASHMPWDVGYKVVCSAHCPVITIRS